MKVVGIRQVSDTNETMIVSVFERHQKIDLSKWYFENVTIARVRHLLDIDSMKVSEALTGFRSWVLTNLKGRFIIDYADTVSSTLYGYVNTLIFITIAIEQKEDAALFRLYWC